MEVSDHLCASATGERERDPITHSIGGFWDYSWHCGKEKSLFHHSKWRESCGIQLHFVDKMQSFSELNVVVHIVTTVLYSVS